jgi:hypothetical protein
MTSQITTDSTLHTQQQQNKTENNNRDKNTQCIISNTIWYVL